MTARPVEILGVATPGWETEDVAMLKDMATKWLEAEVAPRYEEFEKAEIVDKAVWRKAGEAGLLCPSVPEEYGGAGGSYAHETAIIEAISHVGVDGFGIGLHNGYEKSPDLEWAVGIFNGTGDKPGFEGVAEHRSKVTAATVDLDQFRHRATHPEVTANGQQQALGR